MNHFRKLLPFLLLLAFSTVFAQTAIPDATCSAIVHQAMAEVETTCAPTGRNQACYGYVSLQATAREGVTNFQFRQQGDLADVADLANVQLDPLNAAANTWGIVMMKLQASLPEALPGQNVTFLLFGDVNIENAVDPNTDPVLQPMQAFYFNTGITQTECASVPADGILIQTPEGAGKVNMRANGVDIQLGSTAFLRAQPDENLTVSVLEGGGIVRAEGKTVIVPDGAEVDIPLDENSMADGEPGEPHAYDLDFLDDLPIEGLPEDFIIDEPSSDEELDEAFFESEELDLLDDEHDAELEDEHLLEDELDAESEDEFADEAPEDESVFEDEDGGDEDFGGEDEGGE